MSKTPFKKISFYYRGSNPRAPVWEKRIKSWIKKRYPETIFLETGVFPKQKKDAPNLLIVLGGAGTILEASQKYQRWNSLIFGLNLGHVGFLASVREPKNFFSGISKIFRKKYRALPRMLIKAVIYRKNKKIFSAYALNDVAVQNLLGMVDIEVFVDNHPVQYIHGTGVLIATATGTTAYNLSAHGPIVMPDIKCLIITELLDHNIPTPSLIIKRNRNIILKIKDFRKQNRFIIKKTGEAADVILTTDTETIISLQKGDKIIIRRSERLVRFAELEKNYFFKSLQEKFAFR